MEVIHVPRPSTKAMDPDRAANALLLAQVSHLQHAERRLPLRYRSDIYTHAIRTEGEAANYIREVTEAIHRAHADAEKQRAKRARGLEAAERPKRNRPSKGKKKAAKSAKKKSK
jgi:hypothetical protein